MGKRIRLVLLGAAVLAVATGALRSGARAGGTGDTAVQAPAGGLVHAGRWIVDSSGRVVVIHGVNMPSKAAPAYPGAIGFGDDDAAFLASQGFNAVRLTVERYAVEPQAGVFDDTYLAHIADTVDTLAAHGILTLLDFHQDDYGPVFADNGYPAWMTVTDGAPNAFFLPFPTQYLANPALERAFDHLWADAAGPSGRPLQTDDAALLSHAATALRGLPDLLGYEILNEPWPGSAYPTCANTATGCPAFDRGPFSAYYTRMVGSLRAADPAGLIWYEPHSMFNQGVPTSVVPPRDSNLGFAFHDYGLCGTVDGTPASAGACAPEDTMVVGNALSHQAATGDALLETEFGATFDTSALNQQLALYDRNMIPWMFWSYTRYIDGLSSDGSLEPPTPANVNQTMLATLARPYPQLVAGTPLSWHFDPTTRRFAAVYSTRRADRAGWFPPGSETDVSVPPIQYPHGYRVAVEGGTVASAPDAPILRVWSTGATVTVSVTPAPPG